MLERLDAGDHDAILLEPVLAERGTDADEFTSTARSGSTRARGLTATVLVAAERGSSEPLPRKRTCTVSLLRPAKRLGSLNVTEEEKVQFLRRNTCRSASGPRARR